jgi:hypothetical protein
VDCNNRTASDQMQDCTQLLMSEAHGTLQMYIALERRSCAGSKVALQVDVPSWDHIGEVLCASGSL